MTTDPSTETMWDAARLVGSVHAADPDGVAQVLDARDTQGLLEMCVVLAAMVDEDRPLQRLDRRPDAATQEWRRELTDEQAKELWMAYRRGEKDDMAHVEGYREHERRRALRRKGKAA